MNDRLRIDSCEPSQRAKPFVEHDLAPLGDRGDPFAQISYRSMQAFRGFVECKVLQSVPRPRSAIRIQERVDGLVMGPEGAQLLQCQTLERHDDPGQIRSRVGHVILVQVDDHGSASAQDHMLRHVTAVPRTPFEAARRRDRRFQISQQQRGLDAERPPEAPDLLRPVTDLVEEFRRLREMALSRCSRMISSQPSAAPPCGRSRRSSSAWKSRWASWTENRNASKANSPSASIMQATSSPEWDPTGST